jgi:hypothetical protein
MREGQRGGEGKRGKEEGSEGRGREREREGEGPQRLVHGPQGINPALIISLQLQAQQILNTEALSYNAVSIVIRSRSKFATCIEL